MRFARSTLTFGSVKIPDAVDWAGYHGVDRANHLAWDVEAMVDAGLSPEPALAAMTWRGGDSDQRGLNRLSCSG
jgi:hypothetical protein